MQILLNATYQELYELLSQGVKAVEGFIGDDPERAGSAFIDTGCQHCTEGNTPASHDRGLCWRHRAAQLFKMDSEPLGGRPATYRIEKRSDEGPTEYWSHWLGDPLWSLKPDHAKVYTEAERTEILNKTLKSEPVDFPEGGIWVRVEGGAA